MYNTTILVSATMRKSERRNRFFHFLERITADEATRRSRRSGRDGRRVDKDGIRSGSKFGSSRVLHVAGLTN